MRQFEGIRTRALAAALLLLVMGTVRAGDEPSGAVTRITVKGMHCAGCAKKVASQLQQVPGVSDVQIDVKSGVASVTSESRASPSPRALWEALEQSRYKPVRIDGPSGIFTSKPRI